MKQTGIVCIVLAAGKSSRFGSDKRCARLADGKSLLDATLQSLPPLFSHKMLMLHPGDETLAASIDTSWETHIVPDADQGMGRSLAAGIAAAGACRAALVVLADMPYVCVETYQALCAAADPRGLVVPRYLGQRGNPVAIGNKLFGELLMLDADQGARKLMQTCPEAVHWLDVDDAGILRDVDAPGDLDACS